MRSEKAFEWTEALSSHLEGELKKNNRSILAANIYQATLSDTCATVSPPVLFSLSFCEKKIRQLHLHQSLFKPLATTLARGFSKSARYRFTKRAHEHVIIESIRAPQMSQAGNTNPSHSSLKINICKRGSSSHFSNINHAVDLDEGGRQEGVAAKMATLNSLHLHLFMH